MAYYILTLKHGTHIYVLLDLEFMYLLLIYILGFKRLKYENEL